MIVGAGPRKYEFQPGWAKLPEGWQFSPVVGAVTDSQDRVYVHHRGPHPVIVFDREGNYLKWWGEGWEQGAHGIYINREGSDEFIYLTDFARHIVTKHALDGKLLWTLGTAGKVGENGAPFNKPTNLCFTPDGDFYVSDGYGNARVHHYSPDRKLIKSWGEPGKGPGQFNLVHAVWVDHRQPQRRIYVADRENDRIQVFTPDGELIKIMDGFRQPTDFFTDSEGYMYVPELRSRLTILDRDDNIVAQIGQDELSLEPGKFSYLHKAWTDSHGDMYIGEVIDGKRVQKFLRKR